MSLVHQNLHPVLAPFLVEQVHLVVELRARSGNPLRVPLRTRLFLDNQLLQRPQQTPLVEEPGYSAVVISLPLGHSEVSHVFCVRIDLAHFYSGTGAAPPVVTTGTANPPFSVTTEKEGSVNQQFQSITSMPAYQGCSFEVGHRYHSLFFLLNCLLTFHRSYAYRTTRRTEKRLHHPTLLGLPLPLVPLNQLPQTYLDNPLNNRRHYSVEQQTRILRPPLALTPLGNLPQRILHLRSEEETLSARLSHNNNNRVPLVPLVVLVKVNNKVNNHSNNKVVFLAVVRHQHSATLEINLHSVHLAVSYGFAGLRRSISS